MYAPPHIGRRHRRVVVVTMRQVYPDLSSAPPLVASGAPGLLAAVVGGRSSLRAGEQRLKRASSDAPESAANALAPYLRIKRRNPL